MPASLMEIIDLGDGEIALRRADDESAPLVTIQFSEEALVYMVDNGLEVAKAMIQAGIQAAASLAEEADAAYEGEDATLERVIH